jgi:acyl carrier protein
MPLPANPEATEADVIRFINEDLLVGDDSNVGRDDELLMDDIIDSLGITRLVGFIENRFEITVPPEHVTIENFRNIAQIVSYISARTGSDR